MLFLLLLSFTLGLLMSRTSAFPAQTPLVLNRFIIYICFPAVVLLHLHGLELDLTSLYPAAMPWIMIGLSLLFFIPLGRRLQLSRSTIGCLILVCGLGNTSFVGFPMIEAFYGQGGLATGILVDEGGSFLVVSLIAPWIIMLYSEKNQAFSFKEILKKILFFPPFLAVLAALALKPWTFPEWFSVSLERLSNTLGPLALFSVGFQLKFGALKTRIGLASIGLLFKLLLAPLLLFFLYRDVFHQTGLAFQVTLFEAAMPPMITAGILASEEGLDAELAALLIGLGIPLCFLTLPLWWKALHFFS